MIRWALLLVGAVLLHAGALALWWQADLSWPRRWPVAGIASGATLIALGAAWE